MRLLRGSVLAGLAFSGVLCAQGGFRITTTGPLPAATVGVPYSVTFQTTGAQYPILVWSWQYVIPGLMLNTSTGTISGTPTQAGIFRFSLSVDEERTLGNSLDQVSAEYELIVSGSGTSSNILVAPAALTFTANQGGEAPPPQSVNVVAFSGTASSYTLSIDGGASGTTAPWLSVLPASGGPTPGRLTVSVDPTKVQSSATSLTGRISILGAGTTSPVIVTVTLNLGTAGPSLSTSPGSMRFTKADAQQLLVVHNAGGGGVLNFTATANGNFITSVSPSSGQTPAALTVTANTGTPGAFHGSIHIATSAGSVDVPVSLFVPSPGPALSVSQNGFRFQTVQGAGTSTRQTIRILNVGDAGTTVNWMAELIAGSDWLSLGSTSGTATSTTSGTLVLTAGAGAAAETAGGHYALIRISAAGSENSPQYIVGVLDVAAAGSAALPDPAPAGLYFAGQGSGTQPVAQSLAVGTSSTTAVTVLASVSTTDGANWLSANPVSGAASSASAAQFSISANTTGLKAGVYTGEVDVAIANALRAVNVTLVVEPAAGTVGAMTNAQAAFACVASQIALTETGLVNSFSIPAGYPATLEVQLNDNCGSPIANGTVVASFSNGDPPITLLGDGQTNLYSATWQPGSANSSVAVTLNASSPTLPPASAQLAGGVNANATPAPTLAIDGLLHNLNPVKGAPLAPGTVTQVYGTNFASSLESVGTQTLPTSFMGVQMLIGGLNAPLYFVGPSQINIQVPNELSANEYQALINVNGAYTLPQPVDLVAAVPGVLAPGGSIVAQHSSDYSLVSASNPAKVGEALIIYLEGLGATNQTVASGAPSPSNPLAVVTNPVTVTIDGQTAQLLFTGLTPGFVGLYQINLVVPPNVSSGSVAVSIMQSGLAANASTLAVQ